MWSTHVLSEICILWKLTKYFIAWQDWSAFEFEFFDNSLTFKCHLWPGTKLSMLHVGGERFALLRFTLQWWTICLGIFCEAVVSFLLLLSQTSTSFVHLSSFLITTRELHFFDKHCATYEENQNVQTTSLTIILVFTLYTPIKDGTRWDLSL